jgi:hypothetical protein
MRELFFLGTKTTRDRKTGVLLTPGTNRVDAAEADLLLLRSDVLDEANVDEPMDDQEE